MRDRRNNIDFRVAKIFRYGRTRTQIGVDIYNLTNTDVVTGFNQTFVADVDTWLTPTAIQPARYVEDQRAVRLLDVSGFGLQASELDGPGPLS